MESVFVPATTNFQSQSSRVKNAYGSSEFPGIAVNGRVNTDIELELVPVNNGSDEDASKSQMSAVSTNANNIQVTTRK